MAQAIAFKDFPNQELLEKFSKETSLDGHCRSKPNEKVDSCEAKYGMDQILAKPDRYESFYPLLPVLEEIRQGRHQTSPKIDTQTAEKKVEELIKRSNPLEPFELEGKKYRLVFDDADSVVNNYLRKHGSNNRVSLGTGQTGTWTYGSIFYERPALVNGKMIWVMVFSSAENLNRTVFVRSRALAFNTQEGSVFVSLPEIKDMIADKVNQRRFVEKRLIEGEEAKWYQILIQAEDALNLVGKDPSILTDSDLKAFSEMTTFHELLHYHQRRLQGEIYQGLWYLDHVTGWQEFTILDEALIKIRTLIAILENKIPNVNKSQALASFIFENAPDPRSGGRYLVFGSFVSMKVVGKGIAPFTSGVDEKKILETARKVEHKLTETLHGILKPNDVVLTNLRESWGSASFEKAKPALVKRAADDFTKQGIPLKPEEIRDILLWRSVAHHLEQDEEGKRARNIYTALKESRKQFETWLKENL